MYSIFLLSQMIQKNVLDLQTMSNLVQKNDPNVTLNNKDKIIIKINI